MLVCKKFKVNIQTGLLEGSVFLPTPHCDKRPEGSRISLIVVHGISLPPGEFGSDDVERFFCGKLAIERHPYFQQIASLRVSAHLFIRRTGEVMQFVPFSHRAWHAGESSFKGYSRCNDFSIGIELEGTDTVPYAPVQYDVLSEVITVLRHAYPDVADDSIVGHCDIAPGRKTDPGPAFDWDELKRKLT